jgi:hypothetical protein
MSCVKIGRWIFPLENVIAIESRVDGASVKLKGGHEVRLNKAEAEAFLPRFEQDAVIEDLDVVSDSAATDG